MEHEHGTRSNDGQFGSIILDQGESWTAARNQHVNALIPVSTTAVVLDTATGNCTGLTGTGFTSPILGRFSAITVNASSGSVQLVFG